MSLRTTRLKDATRVGDFEPHSSDLEHARGLVEANLEARGRRLSPRDGDAILP